jgi:hypothetical protein
MVELADIFHQYGPEYRAKFGTKMLPSHLRAMQDIEMCRSETMALISIGAQSAAKPITFIILVRTVTAQSA